MRVIDSVANSCSSRCGDLSLLYALSVDLGIPEILDRHCSGNSFKDDWKAGKLLMVWAINRILHPESSSLLPSCMKGKDLSELTGI